MLASIVAVGAFLVYAMRADASPYVQYGVQDDAWLLGGPGTFDERLDKVDALGVDLVRINIRWDQVAAKRPAQAASDVDPAYNWAAPDVLLEGLRARGIGAVVTLVGTPRWANGGRASNWAPTSASSFANFAYAAATRYPWVRRWVIWNEPNKYWQLRPTSPSTYTKLLLNPAYAALKRANRANLVAGGVTAPRGGTGSMSPVDWIRGMDRAHARLDAYAHHPYPVSRLETPTSGGCKRCENITMADLERLLSSVRARVRREADLADRVRLPDESARPVLRRLAGDAGALPRRGRAPRLPRAVRRHADPLPRPRRGPRRPLAERALHDQRPREALGGRVPDAAGAHSLRGSTATLWGQVRPGLGAQTYRLRYSTGHGWRWLGGNRRTSSRGFYVVKVRVPHADDACRRFSNGELSAAVRRPLAQRGVEHDRDADEERHPGPAQQRERALVARTRARLGRVGVELRLVPVLDVAWPQGRLGGREGARSRAGS